MVSKKEEERQKKRNRVQLDIDHDLDAEMEAWASELGVSRSQLYSLFALDGLDNLDDQERFEEIARMREPQISLRFPFKLKLADRLAKFRKKKR